MEFLVWICHVNLFFSKGRDKNAPSIKIIRICERSQTAWSGSKLKFTNLKRKSVQMTSVLGYAHSKPLRISIKFCYMFKILSVMYLIS